MNPISITPQYLLQAAQVLLADPSRWNPKFGALTDSGFTTDPDDPNATRWCLSTAIDRVHADLNASGVALNRFSRPSGQAEDAIFRAIALHERCDTCLTLIDWNATAGRQHADVMFALRTAIEICTARLAA